MRSRFTAYAKGDIGYLTETLAPEVRPDFDPVEAMGVATDAEWESLEIRNVLTGGEADDRGEVEYLAKFRLRGQQLVHHERARSEEHTSEIQSLMRNSYAVFCLKQKNN